MPRTPVGKPMRTGIPRISSANSVIPSSRTEPPVSTTPAESCSSIPVSSMRLRMTANISSTRGSTMSLSTRRGARRGF